METSDRIILSRDCEATLIPSGTKITLTAGQPVQITQALGGSYTVIINGNMARIEGKDADAIGRRISEDSSSSKQVETSTGLLDEKLVWDQMKTCYDPEIPVNIVDLGLIYDCKITPLSQGNRVDVKMTLTAPGCGMGPSIKADVENKIRTIPGVVETEVELVWDPVWNQGMMTEAAKLQLGLL